MATHMTNADRIARMTEGKINAFFNHPFAEVSRTEEEDWDEYMNRVAMRSAEQRARKLDRDFQREQEEVWQSDIDR